MDENKEYLEFEFKTTVKLTQAEYDLLCEGIGSQEKLFQMIQESIDGVNTTLKIAYEGVLLRRQGVSANEVKERSIDAVVEQVDGLGKSGVTNEDLKEGFRRKGLL